MLQRDKCDLFFHFVCQGLSHHRLKMQKSSSIHSFIVLSAGILLDPGKLLCKTGQMASFSFLSEMFVVFILYFIYLYFEEDYSLS